MVEDEQLKQINEREQFLAKKRREFFQSSEGWNNLNCPQLGILYSQRKGASKIYGCLISSYEINFETSQQITTIRYASIAASSEEEVKKLVEEGGGELIQAFDIFEQLVELELSIWEGIYDNGISAK